LQNSKTIPEHSADLNNLIFPHKTFQTGWEIVRAKAGVPHLRLRDLRRDWVTRLARLGFSDKLAQRAAGHKQIQVNFDYTEFDQAAALQAKALIDADNVMELGETIN
jgi:integrase